MKRASGYGKEHEKKAASWQHMGMKFIGGALYGDGVHWRWCMLLGSTFADRLCRLGVAIQACLFRDVICSHRGFFGWPLRRRLRGVSSCSGLNQESTQELMKDLKNAIEVFSAGLFASTSVAPDVAAASSTASFDGTGFTTAFFAVVCSIRFTTTGAVCSCVCTFSATSCCDHGETVHV